LGTEKQLKASLRCDSKEVKLSKQIGYVQAWCHDTPPANITVPPAQGAGATGIAPSGMAPPSSAAMAALTPLLATPSSYVQPLTPTMGGLLQSTYGEFEPWTGGRPLYDWTGLDSTWVISPNHQISFILQAPVELRNATTIVKRD
jgi:hypothetical protein